MQPLPIDPLLPEIVTALASASRLVLRAPPGAGKTTRVPAALLDAGLGPAVSVDWVTDPSAGPLLLRRGSGHAFGSLHCSKSDRLLANGKQIVVLEPRRIAARAAAEFVARERGGTVGQEIGYRVRFEQRGGPATRLWFVTEGVLGRQLARDPFLEDVGIVVLDEFHERHLAGDVALAVIRELQDTVRPDLKIAVMSATLETERLAAYLGHCPILTSEGRTHPVAVEYAPVPDRRPLAAHVAATVQHLLSAADDGGDMLVFLPGSADIRRTAAALESLARTHGLAVVLLHGDLPLEMQQQAIRRGPRRKVVLSTNVAETALTIEGVTTVIDSGLARIAWFDTRHGINALRVMPISRAAAAQRAGRAGRTAPGRCVRLWARAEHDGRREREIPEVLRLDLSQTLLELHAWGLRDARRFRWLDAPGEAAVQRAEHLLLHLGAIDPATGTLTATGRRMLDLAVPPRLARMLVEAERRNCAAAGALLAALAAERDICLEQRALSGAADTRWPSGRSDLLLRLERFRNAAGAGFDARTCRALDLDPPRVRAVERTRRHLLQALGKRQAGAAHFDEDALLCCVLAGFPDRVVRRRAPESPRGLMVGGTGVALAPTSVVRAAPLFVAVEVDAGPRREFSEARVRIASAVEPQWLEDLFPAAVRQTSEFLFDPERAGVVRRARSLFDDLVLEEHVDGKVDPLRAGEVLAKAARRDPSGALALGVVERRFLQRVSFLHRWMPELGLPGSDALLLQAVTALCGGRCSFDELRSADVLSTLQQGLTAPQRRALDREAPAQYRLPTGRQLAIRYDDDKPPSVAVRIQELFGLTATPRLAAGRVALVIELLAPNSRPVQITDDLESFWRRTYPEVRKQLRGRYPKHPWPEDPLHATPTSRTKHRPGTRT